MKGNMEIIFNILPVILLIVLGVVFEKSKFISNDTVNGIKKVVVHVSLPCLLFLTFLKTELKAEYMIISLVVFIICLIGFVMGFLFQKMQNNTNEFYPALFSSFVTGLMGYSLFIAAFGTDDLYKLAILDIGNVLFIYIVLANFLDRIGCQLNDRKRMGFKDLIKNVVQAPVMIGTFLGLLISLTGGAGFFVTNPATAALVTTLQMIANTTVPLILLVIGYELHFDLKHFLAPVYAVLLRLTMMLSLAYLVNHFIIDRILGLDRMFQLALYTMLILPPAFVIPVFIRGDCEDKNFILNFLSIHVIISLVAFIILITVIR